MIAAEPASERRRPRLSTSGYLLGVGTLAGPARRTGKDPHRPLRAMIGAELFISPKTAGVHVSNILRKLGVSGRVQAAALAERAGLLPSGPS